MPKRKNNKYTKEQLVPIIKEAYCWTDVCRQVGVKPLTGAQTHLKNVAIKYGIDFSHFLGRSVTKGRPSTNKPKPIEVYLNNEIAISSGKLRLRLIKEGLKEEKCELCGLTHWLNGKIPLELDHIDSNHHNNSLDNLQILCPNCHAILTRERRKRRRKK